MTIYNELLNCMTGRKLKKAFKQNIDYHSPYQIHKFSEDDIPGDHIDNECDFFYFKLTDDPIH